MAIGARMSRQQSAVEKSLHDQTDLLPKKKLIVVFVTLAMTLCITFIDQNGISVALPTIARDLDAQNTVSWAGTSSLIANTTFQMLYGRLSDIFGRKRVFLAAVGSLALADLLCGLSRNGPMFYVFRGVAGAGGGGVTNLSMIIVSDVVSLEQRGFYQGIIGACVGFGNLIGPFVAAGLTARTTWRAYFYMLAPLVVLVGCAAAYLLPSNPPTGGLRENARKIDYWGVFSASTAVILLLIPISGGGSYFRWDSPMVISMLVIGSLLFIAFIFIELRVAKLPMMPRQYLSRMKRYGEMIWCGFGSLTLGAGLMLLNTRTTSVAAIVVPLMLMGAGIGLSLQPTLVALQSHTSKSRRAVVISVRNFFRATGGAFGLAVAAAVLQAALRAHLPAEYAYLADNAYYRPAGYASDAERTAVLNAYMAASHAVFILQVPLAGVCFLCCIFVRDEGLEPSDVREARLRAAAEADVGPAAAGAGLERKAGSGSGLMEKVEAEAGAETEDSDDMRQTDEELGQIQHEKTREVEEITNKKNATSSEKASSGAVQNGA
ncbi:Major facilitator superfamily domain, general substrate transporter [Niveomyces insectorum RCEF 264]|uniref:Major facilitator superfamily domain, general substrate transporter n=1 Tax=Niveomyces insectorum RCEF 264 TaxID=1081102 RepID=A0A167P0K2_9HYPO|nr:Major facilitator superfamily domain, general substrate transporter [Niveomyces insectorum RCEF 264]